VSKPRTPPDRETLALRTYDVLFAKQSATDSLSELLHLIEGLGGYLSASCEVIDGDYPFEPTHLYSMGDALVKTARVAQVLAQAIAEGAQ